MGRLVVVTPADDRWFFTELTAGIVAQAKGAGHEAVLCRIPLGEAANRAAADAISAVFADEATLGAVLAGFQYRGEDPSRVLAWHKPVVVVGGSTLGFPVISFDDIGVGRTATQHLLQLGHHRIAHLTGPLKRDTSMLFMRRRARGYRSTMESAGLTPHIVSSSLELEPLRDQIRALLAGAERPTGVFAVYDEIAFTVLEIAAELGLRVGSDLSVIGVNDHPDSAGLHLSTVRHRPAEVGATAAQMILDGLQPGPDPTASQLHPSTLVPRASSHRLHVA